MFNLNLDFSLVELTFPQTFTERLPRRVFFALGLSVRIARGWDEDIKNAVFRRIFSLGFDPFHFKLTGLFDGDVDQVSNNGVDIAPDIAHFSELGGFNFDKRGVGQLGQASRNFGFADPGGADHENILRHDLVTQRLRDLLAAPAVTQGDGYGSFRFLLANNMLVEFGDNFPGGHVQGGHKFAFQLQGFNNVILVRVNAQIAGNTQ